ncbi:hypothetical protein HDU81_000564, partial [Chytriomyces hyalinus]
ELSGFSDENMNFGSLKDSIIAQCGGLIGTLRQSVDALSFAFAECHPSEAETLAYYNSIGAVQKMARVFGSLRRLPIDNILKSILAACSTSEWKESPTCLTAADDCCFTGLQMAGILVEEGGCVKFSSKMSQRYFTEVLYPVHPSNAQQSFRVLSERSIENMSRNLLAGSDRCPKEAATFHGLQRK